MNAATKSVLGKVNILACIKMYKKRNEPKVQEIISKFKFCISLSSRSGPRTG